MGFFQALGRFLGGSDTRGLDDSRRDELMRKWNLYDEKPADLPDAIPDDTIPGPIRAVGTSEYDRAQWHRRLKTILERLPESEDQWPELMADIKALGFDPDWVNEAMQAEFVMLMRRAVADRTLTTSEHRKLELARVLIGIPEDQAEATLQTVIREAESFFGGSVENAG
jgi:hypothetical protein